MEMSSFFGLDEGVDARMGIWFLVGKLLRK